MSELDRYEYELPPDLIAHEPPARREDARLMVLRRANQSFEHRRIVDLPELLAPGDTLVFNDTRVVAARLRGFRSATGGRWEGLFLDAPAPGLWRLIGQTRGFIRIGEQITVTAIHQPDCKDHLTLTLVGRGDDGVCWVRVDDSRETFSLLDAFGTIPLPPYIDRDLATDADRERYQTSFARNQGAVAAPTAGLHFTPELLQNCQLRQIESAYVTLHVGIGTFRPIAVSSLDEHQMHAEWCEISPETAELLNVRRTRGRTVAVGTTSVRTLETAATSGVLQPFRGETSLFIRPPYAFRAVDVLLTNFHLPRSSLLVMLSAFVELDWLLAAYREAIAERYRFFSYGDAMLIL